MRAHARRPTAALLPTRNRTFYPFLLAMEDGDRGVAGEGGAGAAAATEAHGHERAREARRAAPDAAERAPTPSDASMMRESYIQQGVNFLLHPSARETALYKRVAFLASKGLSAAELDAAVQRAGLADDDRNDQPDAGSAAPGWTSWALPAAVVGALGAGAGWYFRQQEAQRQQRAGPPFLPPGPPAGAPDAVDQRHYEAGMATPGQGEEEYGEAGGEAWYGAADELGADGRNGPIVTEADDGGAIAATEETSASASASMHEIRQLRDDVAALRREMSSMASPARAFFSPGAAAAATPTSEVAAELLGHMKSMVETTAANQAISELRSEVSSLKALLHSSPLLAHAAAHGADAKDAATAATMNGGGVAVGAGVRGGAGDAGPAGESQQKARRALEAAFAREGDGDAAAAPEAAPKKETPEDRAAARVKAVEQSMDNVLKENTRENVAIAASMLLMCLGNLVKQPEVPRYRRLATTNSNYKRCLEPLNGLSDLLRALGFETRGTYWQWTWLPDDKAANEPPLERAIELLKAPKRTVEAAGGAEPPSTGSSSAVAPQPRASSAPVGATEEGGGGAAAAAAAGRVSAADAASEAKDTTSAGSIAQAPADASVAVPATLAEVMAMVKAGVTPPGIVDVEDRLSAAAAAPSAPQLPQRTKPWQIKADSQPPGPLVAPANGTSPGDGEAGAQRAPAQAEDHADDADDATDTASPRADGLRDDTEALPAGADSVLASSRFATFADALASVQSAGPEAAASAGSDAEGDGDRGTGDASAPLLADSETGSAPRTTLV